MEKEGSQSLPYENKETRFITGAGSDYAPLRILVTVGLSLYLLAGYRRQHTWGKRLSP